MIHKKFTGKVVSNKMMKTVVVEVQESKRHPLYEKVLRRTKKFKAACEDKLDLGVSVVIEQTRPLSKEKSWRVVEILAEEKNGKDKK